MQRGSASRSEARIFAFTGALDDEVRRYVRTFMKDSPRKRMISIMTTRSQKPDDLPDEYHYDVHPDEFAARVHHKHFFWTQTVDGHRYGLLSKSLWLACEQSDVSTLIVNHECVFNLCRQFGERVKPYFILAPDDGDIRSRLRKAGADDAAIARVIVDCRRRFNEAARSGIPYAFVPYQPVPKAAAQDVLQRL